MTEHRLKTQAEYWDAIARGDKNFEVRRDDRGFQKGDILILRRMSDRDGYRHYDDSRQKPIRKQIGYILTGGQFGIEAGYIVIALENIPEESSP